MTEPNHYQYISAEKLSALHAREQEQFYARTQKSATLLARAKNSMIKGVPMSWMYGLYRHPTLYVESGTGATFRDVDGNPYIDFNVVDLAMTMGFAHPSISAAVNSAMTRGAHFLLPVSEAIDVTEELARRTGMPYWQFTLSASGANTEVLRIARAFTRRNKVLVFEGHYHGHIEDTMMERADGEVRPDALGLRKGAEHDIEIVPFNDLAAVEAVLKRGEVAVVMAEPAMSNCLLVLPEPGYLPALYALCQRYGTLLCLDEAHNFSFAYGGLKRAWDLPCDFLVLGKGLGTGVSFALYGMSTEMADFLDAHTAVDLGAPGIGAGGTTYASTIAVLAAKAALEQVLTMDAYARLEKLGLQLASGLQKIFDELELPWCALHLGPRSGYCLQASAPRDGAQAYESIDIDFIAARKLFMANRGIWDAMPTAGPQVSFAHTEEDVERYLALAREFLGAIKV